MKISAISKIPCFSGTQRKDNKKPQTTHSAAILESKPVQLQDVQTYFIRRTVPDNIEFKPAKDIEEAKDFAKNSLGITFYHLTDLDCANYVNEALANYYNNSSDKSIIVSSCTPSFVYLAAITGGCLEISQNVDEKLNSAMQDYKDKKYFEILSDENLEDICSLTESQMKYLNYFKNDVYDELPFKEKIGYHMFLRDFTRDEIPLADNGKLALPDGGDFWIINHEIGHIKHRKNIGNAEYYRLQESFSLKKNSAEDLAKKFKELEPKWEVIKKVSRYATVSPVEFVAEVFACLSNGYEFDDDVMDLYEKYGGPKIT